MPKGKVEWILRTSTHAISFILDEIIGTDAEKNNQHRITKRKLRKPRLSIPFAPDLAISSTPDLLNVFLQKLMHIKILKIYLTVRATIPGISPQS